MHPDLACFAHFNQLLHATVCSKVFGNHLGSADAGQQGRSAGVDFVVLDLHELHNKVDAWGALDPRLCRWFQCEIECEAYP